MIGLPQISTLEISFKSKCETQLAAGLFQAGNNTFLVHLNATLPHSQDMRQKTFQTLIPLNVNSSVARSKITNAELWLWKSARNKLEELIL